MILFYSNYCQHCSVLLETIKKYDKNNIIKLLNIDTLRTKNIPIDPLILSVPALLKETNDKQYIFGKDVFDFLLLPNRGLLFGNNATRIDKPAKDAKDISNLNMMSKDDNEKSNNTNDPVAFTLGNILSEKFSNIDDKNNNILNDRNYNWELIDTNINSNINIDINEDEKKNIKSESSINESKKLPSMEEILKKRELDIHY